MSMTFHLRPACELSGLSLPMVAKWVEQNRIDPYKRGGRGRGGNHLFSPRQLLALTVIAAVYDSGDHCCPCCAGIWMRRFEKMTDSDVRNFIGGSGPCCTEFAEEFLEELVEDWRAKQMPEFTNVSDRVSEDLAQRLQRVGHIVLAALDDGQPDFGEGNGAQAKDRSQIIERLKVEK
jgi:hypothetical protein